MTKKKKSGDKGIEDAQDDIVVGVTTDKHDKRDVAFIQHPLFTIFNKLYRL
jgi:hypothetical protein